MALESKITKWILIFILGMNTISWSHADLSTEISELRPLLETHKRIVNDLEDYIHKEEEKLTVLKRHLNIFKREQDLAMEDIPNYLGNPINAFTLIKRLTTDLDHIENIIEIGIEYVENLTLDHEDMKYPTEDDLASAALVLTQQQETYHFNVEDMAEGKLGGAVYSSPMSAGDCFELGKVLFHEEYFKNALAWMNIALRKYIKEGFNYNLTNVDIMEYIDSINFYLGAMEHQQPRADGNISHFQNVIAQQEANLQKKPQIDSDEDEEQPSWDVKEWENYEALCQDETEIPIEMSKRSYCQYLRENHPFLHSTSPNNIKPDRNMVPDSMTDAEVDFVKDMVRPRKFKRSQVNNAETDSNSASEDSDDLDDLNEISRIARDMTKFVKYAEIVDQVFNEYEQNDGFTQKSSMTLEDYE